MQKAGRAITIIVVALLGATATACTGQRPRFGAVADAGATSNQKTGDDNVDAVLFGLQHHEGITVSATYKILRKFGNHSSTATVVIDKARWAVTIGDVLVLHTTSDVTCAIAAKTCVKGIQEARLSDTGVTSHFYDLVPIRRLEVAMTRRIGPPTTSQATIAGVKANCVSVPVASVPPASTTGATTAGSGATTSAASPAAALTGSERYCVAPSGLLASWEGADLDVELTGVSSVVLQSAFDQPS